MATTTSTPATTQARCCAGASPHQLCDDPAGLLRTRFFRRQLVSAADLTQDQRHFREKHRRHNRMLHGWGVVCGVGVTRAADPGGKPAPYAVCVDPGYVLGPYGDEILVDQAVAFDVRRIADDIRRGCPPSVDPWCPPVKVDRDPRQTLYLAIRYDEFPARPVQTESGCDCGSDCEYSRTVDGFTLGMLDALPKVYADEESADARTELEATVRCTPRLSETGRPCPPCPVSPWVILADLTVELGGAVTIDQLRHRRFVAAFGPYGFYCAPAVATPVPETIGAR